MPYVLVDTNVLLFMLRTVVLQQSDSAPVKCSVD